MDALQLLKQDHDKVRSLFEDFRSAAEADDGSRMDELAAQILHELEVHTSIEERVFYPAVRDARGGDLGDLTDESNEEHHVVELLIQEIKSISSSDERFKPKMAVMMENVEHHASEEEDEMFPRVRELMGQDRLDQLGQELEAEKRQVESDSMSKGELYEAAREQDIEGRSSMNKEELAEAVFDED